MWVRVGAGCLTHLRKGILRDDPVMEESKNPRNGANALGLHGGRPVLAGNSKVWVEAGFFRKGNIFPWT